MREIHIKIKKPRMINVFGIIIIAGMIISGLWIVNNLNNEFSIRSIAGKFQEFKYATLSFNNVYSGLPGDITNATFYWKDSTNGNGNREIEHETGEGIAAWQQLQLEKLIKFPYSLTGKWDKAGEGVLLPGVNVPQLNNDTGFFVNYSQELKANVFGFGQANNAPGLLNNPALTPTEAYKLDLMMDDGYPDTGNLIATSNETSGCHAAGEYKKENDRKECIMLNKL